MSENRLIFDEYGSQYSNTNVTMVFIHGSFANSKSWRRIIEHFSQTHHCIAINLPGHGGMDDPGDFSEPTLEAEFHVLKEVINKKLKKNQKIHLIGHSYGGVVALAAALNNIIPIYHLTLFEPVAVSVLDTFGETAASNKVNEFITGYQIAVNNNEEFACSRVIDFWGGKGSFDLIPPHIQSEMVKLTQNNLRHWHLCKNPVLPAQDYKKLTIPTTLIYGEKSNPIAIIIAKTLHKNLTNSSCYIIDGATHFMITSHSIQSLELLKISK
jgi:pimeloyl-ACP methyl ester carboxylesterase